MDIPLLRGTLSLVGLPQDTLIVQFVATDDQNNQTTVSQPFIYDRAPLLAVESPLSWSVAVPCFMLRQSALTVRGGNLL